MPYEIQEQEIESSAEHFIQLISGIEHRKMKRLFENIGIYAMLSYVETGKIIIPFIGEITIQKNGSCFQHKYEPSPFLKRSIGQIENGECAEIERMIAKKFKHALPIENVPRKNKKRM